MFWKTTLETSSRGRCSFYGPKPGSYRESHFNSLFFLQISLTSVDLKVFSRLSKQKHRPDFLLWVPTICNKRLHFFWEDVSWNSHGFSLKKTTLKQRVTYLQKTWLFVPQITAPSSVLTCGKNIIVIHKLICNPLFSLQH